jgi:hypothetical protein
MPLSTIGSISIMSDTALLAPDPTEGGPMLPTGKHTDTDYVYVMHFAGEKSGT